MRILQVVTLVSPDGAFGGPVTVAVNQCAALQALGHEAHVAAGHRGPATVGHRGSVPLHLFPVHLAVPGIGFSGLTSPALLHWLASGLSAWDVVHVHMTRDLVTLPAARIAEVRDRPVVVQTHGMIDPSDRLLAKPLDVVLTRPALRSAAAVCHLTSLERDRLLAVGGRGLRLVPLRNGVPEPPPQQTSDTSEDEVLFMARLHERKRPTSFARAAVALRTRHPAARFVLVGPDEGEGAAVSAVFGEAGTDPQRLRWEGPVPPEQALRRLSRACVYVLPSVDEPYPMSVLEALSLGIPCIVTDSCGLAGAVRRADAGLVVGDDVDELTSAIDAVLSDPGRRAEMAARALDLAAREFSMEAVAEELESLYGRARAGGLTHHRSGGLSQVAFASRRSRRRPS